MRIEMYFDHTPIKAYSYVRQMTDSTKKGDYSAPSAAGSREERISPITASSTAAGSAADFPLVVLGEGEGRRCGQR